MIFALKSTFSHKKLKILRPKVMEIFKNLRKKFCEYPPREMIEEPQFTIRARAKVLSYISPNTLSLSFCF
jgi:hypothetical protein